MAALPRARPPLLLCAALAALGACKADVTVYATPEPRPDDPCKLVVTPDALDFGHVALGISVSLSVTLQNGGASLCDVSLLAIAPASDSGFSLAAGQGSTLALRGGESTLVPVSFAASSRARPHQKTGTLRLESNDPVNPSQSVPLVANVDIGCELSASPSPLNFGNIALNVPQTSPVTFTNTGDASCQITNLRLAGGTDIDFRLAAGQPTSFDLAPNASAAVPVSFSAGNAPPSLRTGALTCTTTDLRQPQLSIPLQGYIDTNCTAAGQLIYTVDDQGTLASFNPDTLAFTDISQLHCPAADWPFSMAVDQYAVAWVEYSSGDLYRVDTATGACTATTFRRGQQGFLNFGMGFVFEPTTGKDTLYIAGGQGQEQGPSMLGTIEFPSLAVNTIGPLPLGWAELTGTGDGQLWGFVPASGSTTGIATVAQIDPANGATLKSYTFSNITDAGNWAMKFFGGSFWIFVGNSVYQVPRDTGVISTAILGTTPKVVGAGVSTCAPLH